MEDACADGRLTLIGFLFSPASAARPPRGFGGGGIAGAPPPRWRGGHTWLDHLPASVAFCDVETTGVSQHDRVVSFGGIGMIGRNLAPSGQALSVLCQPWLGAWRSQGGCKLAYRVGAEDLERLVVEVLAQQLSRPELLREGPSGSSSAATWTLAREHIERVVVDRREVQ